MKHSNRQLLSLISAALSLILLIGGAFAYQQKAELLENITGESNGTIVSKSLQRYPEPKEDESLANYDSFFSPIIVFQYLVEGELYTSNTWNPRKHVRGGQAWASEVLERYQVGGDYPVYFNPSNPKDAYLDLKVNLNWHIYVLAGCLFLAVSLILARSTPR